MIVCVYGKNNIYVLVAVNRENFLTFSLLVDFLRKQTEFAENMSENLKKISHSSEKVFHGFSLTG